MRFQGTGIRWLCPTVCLLASFLATVAAADPGYVGFESGAVVFLDEPSITMESEDLVFSVEGGHWQADLTYRFRNDGDARQITVGLPVTLPWDCFMDEEPCSIVDRLDEMVLMVDGEQQPVTWVRSNQPGFGRLYVAEIEWDALQTRTLVYRYPHYVDDRYDIHTFTFLQVTGRGWSGPIEEVNIRLQLQSEVRAVDVNLPARLDDDWLVIELTNWEPDRDLHVNLLREYDAFADWFGYFNMCQAVLRSPSAERQTWVSVLGSLATSPPIGTCVEFPHRNRWWSGVSFDSSYCPISAEEVTASERHQEELDECIAQLENPPETVEDIETVTETVVDAYSYDEVEQWLSARLSNSRENQSELVRIPVNIRSSEELRIYPEAYILQGGIDPYASITWINLVPGFDEVSIPNPAEETQSLVVEGTFSGRFRIIPQPLVTNVELEFETLRFREASRESDNRLRLLLEPEATAEEVPTFSDSRSYLVIVDSIHRESDDRDERATQLVSELTTADFPLAEAFDSRRAPRLFCCYTTIVAGRYDTQEEAAQVAEAAREQGFEDTYVRIGWSQQAEGSTEVSDMVDYERGEQCPSGDRNVWPWWQGEYPRPVVSVVESTTLNAVADVCQPDDGFQCTVSEGLYHPWSDIEAEYRTVKAPNRYRNILEFELDEETIYPPETIFEIPYYMGEGYCIWTLPDGSEMEDYCPETWDEDEGPVFERIDSDALPPTQQFFLVRCAEGPMGWIETTDELLSIDGITEGNIPTWGEVGP